MNGSGRRGLALTCGGLALLAVLLTAPGWDAPFLPYDDPDHTYQNPQVLSQEWTAVFSNPVGSTYFPVTLLSHRMDRALFHPPGAVRSVEWARGSRVMNTVYHAVAGMVLFGVLLALGYSRGTAFFVAAFWVAHPTACESVCWVSERKNTLAALFGFSALLASLRLRGSQWRGLAVAALYLLALFSKPSALGLLPVLGLLEFVRFEDGVLRWQRPQLLRAAAYVAPLAALSAWSVVLNLNGHRDTLVQPPGGSVFTALLTDSDILLRYLYAAFVPVELSVAHAVEPIGSLASGRFWINALLLAALAGATAWAARSRARAGLGWFWMLAALGPHLNLIAIAGLMQDRYLYLALPGLGLVLVECAAGVAERVPDLLPRMLPVLGGVYLLALLGLGVVRAPLFGNMLMLFQDAAGKQPRSAHAQYGLSQAWYQAQLAFEREPAPQRELLDEARRKRREHLFLALEQSLDLDRQGHRARMYLDAGDVLLAAGETVEAERWYRRILEAGPDLRVESFLQSEALNGMGELRLRGKQAAEALQYAGTSLRLRPGNAGALLVKAGAFAALHAAGGLSVAQRAELPALRSALAAAQEPERRRELNAAQTALARIAD